eukprot:SM000047S16908  [mRNA]  locus=s47:590050:592714:+ [translate_table: standard]
MAAFDAVTELPPPSRTWEGDEDLEGPRRAAEEPEPAFQWSDAAGSALGAHLNELAEVATLTLNTRLPEYLDVKHRASISRPVDLTLSGGNTCFRRLQDVGTDDTPSREYRCTVLAPRSPRLASPVLLAAACHPAPPADCCFRVLILGSMPSSNYRGLSHGDEPLLFSLHTDAERATICFGDLGVPLLPPGSLVEGLSASVLSHDPSKSCPSFNDLHAGRCGWHCLLRSATYKPQDLVEPLDNPYSPTVSCYARLQCQVRGIPTVAVVHVLHGAISVHDLAQLAGALSHLPEVDCMVAEQANGHWPSRPTASCHLDLPLRKAQNALIKQKRTLAVSDLYI